MKIYLLIYMITSGPYAPQNAQPNVQRLEMSSLAACTSEGQSVIKQLRHTGCDGVKSGCSVPYLVRTACVMGQ